MSLVLTLLVSCKGDEIEIGMPINERSIGSPGEYYISGLEGILSDGSCVYTVKSDISNKVLHAIYDPGLCLGVPVTMSSVEMPAHEGSTRQFVYRLSLYIEEEE